MAKNIVWTVFLLGNAVRAGGRCLFMHDNKLKKWEAALLLSLCITFCHGAVLPNAVGCNWCAPGVQSGGVELRLRLLDLLAARMGK